MNSQSTCHAVRCRRFPRNGEVPIAEPTRSKKVPVSIQKKIGFSDVLPFGNLIPFVSNLGIASMAIRFHTEHHNVH